MKNKKIINYELFKKIKNYELIKKNNHDFVRIINDNRLNCKIINLKSNRTQINQFMKWLIMNENLISDLINPISQTIK